MSLIVFPSNFGTLYQLLFSSFSYFSLSQSELPGQETLRLREKAYLVFWRSTPMRGEANRTKQCKNLNCNAVATKSQHFPEELWSWLALQSCLKWGKGLNFGCLHQAVIESGLTHQNGFNVTKKVSFSQQQSLEKLSPELTKANTLGTWGSTTMSIYSLFTV